MSKKTPQALINLLANESIKYLTENNAVPTVEDYLHYMTHVYRVCWEASNRRGFSMYLGYLTENDPYDRIFFYVALEVYNKVVSEKDVQTLDLTTARRVKKYLLYYLPDKDILTHEARFYLTLPGPFGWNRLKLAAEPCNDETLFFLMHTYQTTREMFGVGPIANWIENEFAELKQS